MQATYIIILSKKKVKIILIVFSIFNESKILSSYIINVKFMIYIYIFHTKSFKSDMYLTLTSLFSVD